LQELKEQRAIQEQEEQVKIAEQQRLSKEQKEREEQRRKEQEEEEKRRTTNDRLEMIRKSELGQKMLKDIDLDVCRFPCCVGVSKCNFLFLLGKVVVVFCLVDV